LSFNKLGQSPISYISYSEDSGAETFQTAEFDGLGRRIKKVVTNAGDLETTTAHYYNGQQIIETRDGSNNVVQQFIHGTQYIDELVMVRVASKGDLYVHQDANWNVIGLTDLGGHLIERYVYTPYGELTVHQITGYGDRDGDGDVDSDDKGTPGTDCTGTVSGSCRILDLDFDGDYDSTDATAFDSLPQGLAKHPGRTVTGVDQPFAHQGLLYDAEIMTYQNRARQYDPAKRRFAQRDPLALRNDALVGYHDGPNLYTYLRLDPIGATDPQGTATCDYQEISPGGGGLQFNCSIPPPTDWFSKCLCALGFSANCQATYCESCMDCCLSSCADYHWPGGNTDCEAACTAGLVGCAAGGCCSFPSPPY